MATETNEDVSSSGFAKILKQKWHTDLRLKAGDSSDIQAISAHKLVLVFFFSFIFQVKTREITILCVDILLSMIIGSKI